MAAIEPPPPPPTMVQQSSTSSGKHHVDYKTLPSPISFEDILRESFTCLRPELFEGMRFDFNKPLNSRFVLSHSVLMGPVELPSQSPETIKVPAAQYEFGANFFDPKMLLIGRLTMDGNLSARLKCDLTDDLILKASAKLTNEPHMSQGTATLDYKGSDYRTQVQLGDAGLIGANYMQSVTPQLALGGELFWSGQYRKSGIGYAARYNSDKTVATAQVATTGLVTLSYVQKATEKVSLATEFMYSYFAREVTAAVGYDCTFRQARVQGKLDSHGCVTAFLEEKLHPGLLLILSAEVDHKNKDYRFGFGFTVGE